MAYGAQWGIGWILKKPTIVLFWEIADYVRLVKKEQVMVMHTPENNNDHSEDESSSDINNVSSSILVDALNALRKFRKHPSDRNKTQYEDTRKAVIQAESSSEDS